MHKIYPNLDFWFENKPSGNPGKADFDRQIQEWQKTDPIRIFLPKVRRWLGRRHGDNISDDSSFTYYEGHVLSM
jgi:hypothetical protein